jgi:transketolase
VIAVSTATALDLEQESRALRLKIIEVHRRAGGGHLGSSLSIVEILTVLFRRHLRSGNSSDRNRDRFILSKGHAALALYCLLQQIGRLPEERLASFACNGAPLEPHPNERLEPLIEASSGSLGQGLSIAVGLALGARLRGRSERIFVLIGDGEANEGQIWEAARAAAHLRLDNLIAVLDANGMQQDGMCAPIMPVDDLAACWQEIGWRCLRCDGHDCAELDATMTSLLSDDFSGPRLLNATTVKGRGVAFLEGETASHFPPPLSPEEQALVEYELDRRGGDA